MNFHPIILLTIFFLINTSGISEDYFPKVVQFRGGMNKRISGTYELWRNNLLSKSGVIQKFLDEELTGKPERFEWTRRLRKEFPEKLQLLHFNGEARQARKLKHVHQRFFPGHWAYFAGTYLTEDISRTQTFLKVKNPSVFSSKGKRNRFISDNKAIKGNDRLIISPDILIVRTYGNGKHAWSEYEYARVTGIDLKRGGVEVQRGRYFSQARSFKALSTYIAPLVCGQWGDDVMWFYNFSTDCPKDKNGLNCSDVIVSQLKSSFSKELNAFDGISFDVHYWDARWSHMDVNNDGKVDGGVIGQRQAWRQGSLNFFQKLRQTMGEDFIIISDCFKANHQRAVGIINGPESEGVPFHRDAYRSYCQFFNIMNYWQEYGKKPMLFAPVKILDKDDLKNYGNLSRFNFAMATCVGAMTTAPAIGSYELPEAKNGISQQSAWLGKAISPMTSHALLTEDIFKKMSVKMTSKDAIIEHKSRRIIIRPKSSEASNFKVVLNNVIVPDGDLLLHFKAHSLKSLEGFEEALAVPRSISINVDGLPQYPGDSKKQKCFNDFKGFFGTLGDSSQEFYFRSLKRNSRITITITFEGSGAVSIIPIQAFNAPQVISRDFENGIVVINPSFKEVKVPLNLISDFRGSYKRISAQKYTASFKSTLIEKKHIEAIQKYNDGRLEKGSISLPPLNAIFLEKVK